MSDFDVEAEARRLAAKWKTDEARQKSPLDGLNEEGRRQAALLLGREGEKKIENAKEGRRVYVAPVRVTYEWYWVKGDFSRMTIWRINRVENGRQRVEHKEGYLEDDLDEAIRDLRGKGFFVADANLDRRPVRKPQPKVSRRKAILEDLRFIRR